MLKIITISIFQCLLLASGLVCFKLAVEKIEKFQWTWEHIADLLSNWWLLASGILMIFATILWGYILKNIAFSIAYPITAIAYIFGMLAAMFIFQEPIPLTRWIGVGLILLGVFFVIK
jgi:undecaprenyl phosphate-alpha-L-ara4N flippase subunit ArnE